MRRITEITMRPCSTPQAARARHETMQHARRWIPALALLTLMAAATPVYAAAEPLGATLDSDSGLQQTPDLAFKDGFEPC